MIDQEYCPNSSGFGSQQGRAIKHGTYPPCPRCSPQLRSRFEGRNRIRGGYEIIYLNFLFLLSFLCFSPFSTILLLGSDRQGDENTLILRDFIAGWLGRYGYDTLQHDTIRWIMMIWEAWFHNFFFFFPFFTYLCRHGWMDGWMGWDGWGMGWLRQVRLICYLYFTFS